MGVTLHWTVQARQIQPEQLNSVLFHWLVSSGNLGLVVLLNASICSPVQIESFVRKMGFSVALWTPYVIILQCLLCK